MSGESKRAPLSHAAAMPDTDSLGSDPAIDREEAKVDKMTGSICLGRGWLWTTRRAA